MKNNFTGDTFGDPLFDEFHLKIVNERAESVTMFDEIDYYFLKNRFSSKVTIIISEKTKLCIEFPINHIDLNQETRQWQVETGPILVPIMEGKRGKFDFMPAFVHFNCFDKIDIFYDYPFGYRSLGLNNSGIYSNIPCSINIFV